MNRKPPPRKAVRVLLLTGIALWPGLAAQAQPSHQEESRLIGRELAVPRHLENGEEFRLGPPLGAGGRLDGCRQRLALQLCRLTSSAK